MFAYFVGIVVFIYLILRIGKLEDKVKKLENRNLQGLQIARDEATFGPMPAAGQTAQAQQSQGIVQPISAAEQPAVHGALPLKQVTMPAPAVVRERTEAEKNQAEFAVGSKWLTAVGIIALFLGVGFFLRYAFTNGLITESMRVVLGLLFGLVLMIVGHVLRKKYPAYGMGLVGAGLGMFYLTIYAAYAFYGIILEPVAFFIFLIITALGIGLSIFYNSSPLIRFSLLGGFIVPLLFPMTASVHALFPYLIILNLAVLIIARYRVWPELTGGSLIASSLLSLKWTLGPDAAGAVSETFAYLAIIFCIYFTTSFINFIKRDRDYKGMDAFLVYALPVLYFLVSAPLIHTKQGFAILSFALAAFYLLASVALRVIFSEVPTIKLCSNIMLMIGGAFLAAAIALHFEGKTLTILWAVEALLMVLIGGKLQARGNRVAGLILAVLVGLKALSTDLFMLEGGTAIFNGRTFTLLMVALMYGVIWFLYKMHATAEDGVMEDEKKAGAYLGAIGVSVFVITWATTEMLHYVNGDAYKYLPVLWALMAVLLAGVSFVAKEVTFRVFGYILSIGALMVMLATSADLMGSDYHAIFNLRFLSAIVLAVAFALVSAMIHKNRDQLLADENTLLNVFYIAINGILLWAFSLEVLDYFNNEVTVAGAYNSAEVNSIENTKRVVLSLLWLGYAVVLLALGIVKKSRFGRQVSVALLAVTILKIFLYDTANLSDIYRFVSFISLGVILLLAGFAYYRFKDRITEFVGVEKR